MTEQELIEQLRRLDSPVMPDMEFRKQLHAELRGPMSDLGDSMVSGNIIPDLVEPPSSGPRRRSGWMVAAAVFSMVILGGLALSLFGATETDSSDATTPVPVPTSVPSTTVTTGSLAEHPVFSQPLPWTLVFDNGTTGVRITDLSTGLVLDRRIEGTRGGDQPFRLTLHDGHLVVGWGEVFAYDIHTNASSLVGSATYHVPAAEPSRVWMVDYPGGSTGSGKPTVWQVHVASGLATEPVTLTIDGIAIGATPGGLVLQTDSGLVVWDAVTESIVARLGTDGSPFISDVAPDGRIAWCEDPCRTVLITDPATGTETPVSHPTEEGKSFDASGARFSDDGRYLAAPAGRDVVVADLETGDVAVVMTMHVVDDRVLTHLNWAPGPVLFASGYSYSEPNGTIGYYSVIDGNSEVITTPEGWTLSFVVVRSSEAGQLLGTEPPVQPTPTEGGECPVTIPETLFTAPLPYSPDPVREGMVWFGAPELWTVLEPEGIHHGQRKSVWWSSAFPGGRFEESPSIQVTWENLTDPEQERITNLGRGTNAFTPEDGDFIIAGIDPDLPGCWRVTATYKGATLSFVYEQR